MSIRTPLCDLLNIRYPIVQAPIGGVSTPRLAAAVSNAGGLGMLSGTWRSAKELSAGIQEIRDGTCNPFGVNLVLSFDISKQLDVCIAERVGVVSFFWGDPGPHISRLHDINSLVMHTVGTAHDAQRAVSEGADIVVAQGIEAGGHVCGTVGTISLIPSVVDAVPGTPVIAAGGIADGRGLAAALCLGASGVMLGSRFVMSNESDAHSAYQEAMAAASESDTAYVQNLFDGGWKEAPHRVLKNSTFTQWKAAGSVPPGSRPGEDEPVAWLSTGDPVSRYSSDAPTKRVTSGHPEAMALYSGQGAGLLKSVESAQDILLRMITEAEKTFQRQREV